MFSTDGTIAKAYIADDVQHTLNQHLNTSLLASHSPIKRG